MTMRNVFRAVAVMAAATLLILAVGCAAPSEEDGHDHSRSDETTTAPVIQKHDHKEPANMRLTYEEEEGGTFTLVIKNCEGDLLIKQTGLTKKAISEQVVPNIARLSWVTSSNPGGYESLYINRLTCQVSDMIVGEQATDGNRIVYSEVKDGKLVIIVRDLFDKNGYRSATEMTGAYTDGEYTVLRATKVNDQVNVTFLADAEGSRRIVSFDLYEKGETPPSTAKKTEATKK